MILKDLYLSQTWTWLDDELLDSELSQWSSGKILQVRMVWIIAVKWGVEKSSASSIPFLFLKKNMTRCGVYVPAWGRTSEARSEKKASFWNACYTHTRALLTDRVNSLMALSTTCCEEPPFTQRLSKVLKLREAWPGPRLAACCFHFIRHLTANLRDPKPITQLNPSLNSDTEILRQRIVAVLGHKVWGWFAAVPNWNTVSGGNVIQLSII